MMVVLMVEYNQLYKKYYGPGHNGGGWGVPNFKFCKKNVTNREGDGVRGG